jgi:hypothetical protein
MRHISTRVCKKSKLITNTPQESRKGASDQLPAAAHLRQHKPKGAWNLDTLDRPKGKTPHGRLRQKAREFSLAAAGQAQQELVAECFKRQRVGG